MRNFLLIICFSIILFSCTETIKEVDRSAGVWVNSGDKYTLGSDDDVEIIKKMIASFNALDAAEMSKLVTDTVDFYPYNAKGVIRTSEAYVSLFDSVQSNSIHFLPYSNAEQGERIVQSIQNENLYWKDGRVDSLHVLNLFFINSEDKVYAIRQFNAEWEN